MFLLYRKISKLCRVLLQPVRKGGGGKNTLINNVIRQTFFFYIFYFVWSLFIQS
jgi:hypothetical protein